MKKLFLAFAAALLVSAGICNSASAQEWPQRTIRIVVSFGPGGGADIIGRILADSLQSKLGQPVIVENKPGAGGILGNDVVAKATPDGYTLGIMTAGQIIAAVTKKNMPYDTNAAFAPVGQVATASLMIVTRPDFPANNVKELVAYAKDHPGKVVLYPIPEIVTLSRFTNQRGSDSYAANDGGSLWRYRFGEISTRHGCGVWRKRPRMGLKPGGCWRLLQSTTV